MTTVPPLKPLPQPTLQLATSDGQVAQHYAEYLSSLDKTVRSGNFPALSVNGSAALTVAGNLTLVGGFNEQPFSLDPLVNNETITPNPSDNLKQSVTNNVAAFTIAATAQIGDVELTIINGASPCIPAFSGFSKEWSGDSFDQVPGHAFVVFIYGFPGGFTTHIIKALQ
jgi:hypothetical protein